MSNRRGSTIKRRRKARPAKTAREADIRWGFAGAAERGELDAYTAEHFDADLTAGVIELPKRECPRHNPGDGNCDSARYCGRHYATRWHQILTYPPMKRCLWPRRERTRSRLICYDCRCWLWHQDRQAFRREHGDYRLEEAELVVRVTRLDGSNRRREIIELTREATDLLLIRERAELYELTGDHTILFARRQEQFVLLAAVRHALTRYRQACTAARTRTAA